MISDENAYGKTPERIYLLSVYYVICTIATVGFGDITANNVGIIESWIVERVFACVLIIFGVLIYTNTVGFISSSLMNSRYNCHKHQRTTQDEEVQHTERALHFPTLE